MRVIALVLLGFVALAGAAENTPPRDESSQTSVTVSNVSNAATSVTTAALLAGFFAAHAVWSISDGETLIPIYAYVDGSGQRRMDRLVAQDAKVSVDTGKERLDQNPQKAQCAVLIYDGYVTISGSKGDALILEIRDYSSPTRHVTLSLPYAPKTASTAFKIFRPKILQFPETPSESAQDFIESFWRGVDEHTQGAAVWNAHIDQSQ